MVDGWRRTDAWIFVSLVIAAGAGRHRRSPTSRRPEGVRLVDVLSIADHLNPHTVPGRDEVEAAVRRLAGAGLITVDDGWFQVTPAGAHLWRTRPPAGIATAVETIRTALNRQHSPGNADWTLDEDEHAKAVREYLARHAPAAPRPGRQAASGPGGRRPAGRP